jgi:hypothetical protein
MKRRNLDDTAPPPKRKSRGDSKFDDAGDFQGKEQERLHSTDVSGVPIHQQQRDVGRSSAASDLVSDDGEASSHGRYSAVSSLEHLISRQALHPLVSSAPSSTLTARTSNVSNNHSSESNASESQQGMGPNQLVNTAAFPQGVSSDDVARSMLSQQNQRQQEIQRLQQLAMALTIQQVQENPGILNALSQLSSPAAAAATAASYPLARHQQGALPPLQALLAPLTIQQILGNPGILNSHSQLGSIPPAAASRPPGINQPEALPPPLPAALLSPEDLLNRLQHQQQVYSILANVRQTLTGPPPIPFQNASVDSQMAPGSAVSPIAAMLMSLRMPIVHPAVDLYMPRDEFVLSEHQILLRKQMEFFQATSEDIQVVTPGRRNEIWVGQVGIRCKHCARGLGKHQYVKGTMYFPATLRAVYQAAQNCGKVHLSDICPKVSTEVKNQLKAYMEMPTTSGYGGKQYWSDCATARGVYETADGLRFR